MAQNPSLKALKSLRWSYIVAFSVLAVMVVASHLLLDRWLKAEERTGVVLTLAGRQRMLSERILRLSLSAEDPVRLRKACLRFRYTHKQMFEGPNPPAGEAPPKLTESFEAFLVEAGRVLEGREASAEMPALQRRFVVNMEWLIDSLGDSSFSAIRRLRRDAQVIATLLLVVILLQAVGIFRPLVRRIEEATLKVVEVCEVVTLGNSVVNSTFSNNVANAATQNFNFGFVANCTATSNQTVTVADNDFRGFMNPAILLATTSELSIASGTISGNTISAPFGTGISAQPVGGTTEISGNILTGGSVVGISLQTQDADTTIVVENNQITDTVSDGFSFFDSDAGNFLIALRNNTITNSGANAVNVNWNGANTLCMEIVGNNFNDVLALTKGGGGGTFNVQDLNTLDTINNLNGVMEVITGTINEADCNIP